MTRSAASMWAGERFKLCSANFLVALAASGRVIEVVCWIDPTFCWYKWTSWADALPSYFVNISSNVDNGVSAGFLSSRWYRWAIFSRYESWHSQSFLTAQSRIILTPRNRFNALKFLMGSDSICPWNWKDILDLLVSKMQLYHQQKQGLHTCYWKRMNPPGLAPVLYRLV